MANHFSILAWKFHGQRSLEGYSPWGHKESDMTEHLSTHTCAFFYIEKYGHSIKLIHLFVQQFIQCLESDRHELFQVGWIKPEAVTSS